MKEGGVKNEESKRSVVVMMKPTNGNRKRVENDGYFACWRINESVWLAHIR